MVHISRKDNIADPLSRLLGESAIKETHERGAEEYVRFVATNTTPRALTTREVEEASAADDELRELRNAVQSGCYDKCLTYAPIAYELCVMGQLVLRATRIILPHSLRARALELAQKGHLRFVGTKQHLRSMARDG